MPYPGVPVTAPATAEDEYWFAAGLAVFHGGTAPGDFPPLDDRTAQRHWLCGFGVAWAECPEVADGWCAQPVDVALMLALEGREQLLAQLCAHGLPPDVVH
jgi:hypothetical protein